MLSAQRMTAGLLISLLLGVSAEAASLRLAWVNNSVVVGHIIEVERCIVLAPAATCGGTAFGKVNQVVFPVSTFTDLVLAEVTKYRYRVRATANSIFSLYSNEAENTTAINDPALLSVTVP